MNSISVYAGSKEDGPRLETRLDDVVKCSGGQIKSRSELIRKLIDEGLKRYEKLYPPLPAVPQSIAA